MEKAQLSQALWRHTDRETAQSNNHDHEASEALWRIGEHVHL